MSPIIETSLQNDFLAIYLEVEALGSKATYSGAELAEVITSSSARYIIVHPKNLSGTSSVRTVERTLRDDLSFRIILSRGVFGLTSEVWSELAEHVQTVKGLEIFVSLFELNKRARIVAHALDADLEELRKRCDQYAIASFERYGCHFELLGDGQEANVVTLLESRDPQISPEDLQEAVNKLQIGKAEEALATLTSAAYQSKRNSSLFYLKAVAEAQLGKFADSVRSSLSAIDLDSKNIAARQLLEALRNSPRADMQN
jgi:hypothetical protein